MGIALTCNDCVDCSLDIYLRRVEVENLRGGERDVRLFRHHDFNIGGSREGDTAYYDPAWRALIHYKGRHWFMVSGTDGKEWGLSSYATGRPNLRRRTALRVCKFTTSVFDCCMTPRNREVKDLQTLSRPVGPTPRTDR